MPRGENGADLDDNLTNIVRQNGEARSGCALARRQGATTPPARPALTCEVAYLCSARLNRVGARIIRA
jgi:hypothetical protein